MVAGHGKKIDVMTGLLHDCVAPQLFISRCQLEMLIKSLDNDTLSDSQHARLIKSWQALKTSHDTLREIMRAPERPEAFYPQVRQALATYTPLLDFKTRPVSEESLMADKQLGVCLSELLANVYKHTPDAEVAVKLAASGGRRVLRVESFTTAPAAKPEGEEKGFGLRLLHQRAAAFGGEIIYNNRADGFTAEVRLPEER